MSRFFDGVDDRVDIGDVAALKITGDKISISAWVKIASKTAEKKLVAKWSDSPAAFSYLLTLDTGSNDLPRFAINNASDVSAIAAATTNLVIGTWTHIVGTYDGVNVKIYVNGVLEGTTAQTGNIKSTTTPVRIGMGSGTPPEDPMHGDIGHVAIWNIDLKAGEALSLGAGRVSPRSIRGGANLPFDAPLNGQSPELDIIGGLDLTVIGTTAFEEPPIPNCIVAP